MRAAAEVGEGAVGVERDGVQPGPPSALLALARSAAAGARVTSPTLAVARTGVRGSHEVVDQLDLVVLPRRREARARVRDRNVLALEVLRRLDVRAHPLFDRREVGLGDAYPVGELEVVVEALLDRRADRDLHARVQLHHCRGEHMSGVVADQPQRLLTLAASGENRDRGAVGQRPGEVAQLAGLPSLPDRHTIPAADLHRQRRPRQASTDRGGCVGAGGADGKLQRVAVGEGDRGAHRALEATGPLSYRLPQRVVTQGGALCATISD